jgi:cystathionine beta-synthase
VGTGGTISGTGRYLKEQNSDMVVVGADPEGSLYTGKEARPYLVEGIGEDFWPDTLDREIVDRWVTVSDRDSFLCARRVTRAEGLLVGGSSGTAMHAALEVAADLGPEHVVVVILPDSGRAYLSKLYSDAWMLEYGFLERPGTLARIGEVQAAKRRYGLNVPELIVIPSHEKVGRAIDILEQHGISQAPVARSADPQDLSEIVGSINERSLLDRVFRDREAIERDVAEVMGPPLSVVQRTSGVEDMFEDLSRGAEAVIVADGSTPAGVLTRADLLEFLAHSAR